MTTKQLQDKINELEKRVSLLESQKQIINVYPYYQPAWPQYPPTPKITPNIGPWNTNGQTTVGGALFC